VQCVCEGPVEVPASVSVGGANGLSMRPDRHKEQAFQTPRAAHQPPTCRASQLYAVVLRLSRTDVQAFHC
jgi:hypothetical protein